MRSADNFAMSLGNINGHVGRHINGFDGVHGGYDVGQEFGRSSDWRKNCMCQIHSL